MSCAKVCEKDKGNVVSRLKTVAVVALTACCVQAIFKRCFGKTAASHTLVCMHELITNISAQGFLNGMNRFQQTDLTIITSLITH